MEIEKRPIGYPYSRYEVSTNGQIYKIGDNEPEKQHNPTGYLTVAIYHDYRKKFKNVLIHRLVATVFLINDDPKHKIQVDHLDRNPLNNHVTNLEWKTPSSNNQNRNKLGSSTKIYHIRYEKKGWRVLFGINGQRKTVYYGSSFKEAVIRHEKYIIENNLDKSYLNFPNGIPNDEILSQLEIDKIQRYENKYMLPDVELFDVRDDVKDYPGYKISKCGKYVVNCKNPDKPFVLNQKPIDKKRYLRVKLNGEDKRVHRLVAYTFKANDDPEHKIYVDHVNGIGIDNNVGNLRFCIAQQNTLNRNIDRTKVKRKYKNVEKRDSGNFSISIKVNGKKYTWTYTDEIQAAREADMALIYFHGREFVKLNFPDEIYDMSNYDPDNRNDKGRRKYGDKELPMYISDCKDGYSVRCFDKLLNKVVSIKTVHDRTEAIELQDMAILERNGIDEPTYFPKERYAEFIQKIIQRGPRIILNNEALLTKFIKNRGRSNYRVYYIDNEGNEIYHNTYKTQEEAIVAYDNLMLDLYRLKAQTFYPITSYNKYHEFYNMYILYQKQKMNNVINELTNIDLNKFDCMNKLIKKYYIKIILDKINTGELDDLDIPYFEEILNKLK